MAPSSTQPTPASQEPEEPRQPASQHQLLATAPPPHHQPPYPHEPPSTYPAQTDADLQQPPVLQHSKPRAQEPQTRTRQQQELRRQEPPPPSPVLQQGCLLWTLTWQPAQLASEQPAPLGSLQQELAVPTQLEGPLPPAEPTLRLPQPFGLGFSLRYLMWKASFRPSRLTSRAEWQRIDSVDTLCPPLDRTDSVNIPSD